MSDIFLKRGETSAQSSDGSEHSFEKSHHLHWVAGAEVQNELDIPLYEEQISVLKKKK